MIAAKSTMTEAEQARVLANKVLDNTRLDPDGDLSVLARQLLRADERVQQLRTASDPAEIERVAKAISTAWNECRDVPFFLYQHEAEAMARAAIAALRQPIQESDR